MRKRVLVAAAVMGLAGWAAQGSQEAGRHEQGGDEPGDPYVWNKWVNFAILAGGIGYLAVKGGGAALRGQQRTILKKLDEAARRAEQTSAETAAIERKVVGLEGEIEAMRRRAAEEMAAERRAHEAETARLLEKVEQAAALEVASAVERVKKELKAETADLALSMAAERLRVAMGGGAQERMVARFIESTGRLDGRGN